MGTSTEPWHWTTSGLRTSSNLPAFRIATAPVTNGEYSRVRRRGRLPRPTLVDRGRMAASVAAELDAPQHWSPDADGTWWRRRFGVVEPVPLDEPVVHVCAHEADAFAAWAARGCRARPNGRRPPVRPRTGLSRRYPWGDEDPTPVHANLGQTPPLTRPVGRYPQARRHSASSS